MHDIFFTIFDFLKSEIQVSFLFVHKLQLVDFHPLPEIQAIPSSVSVKKLK